MFLYGIKGYEYKNPNNKIYTEITDCIIEPFIEKDNGSEISLGFFSDNQMEEVSAVLFSNVATMGKIRALTKEKTPREMFFIFNKFNANGYYSKFGMFPKQLYSVNLDSGLCLYLNPFANYPIEMNFIKKIAAWQSFDFDIKMSIGEVRYGELFS